VIAGYVTLVVAHVNASNVSASTGLLELEELGSEGNLPQNQPLQERRLQPRERSLAVNLVEEVLGAVEIRRCWPGQKMKIFF
jgi:hypothetical protein